MHHYTTRAGRRYPELMRVLARVLLNGAALLVAAWLTPGLYLEGAGVALLAGAVLGIVNALLKPLLIVFTLPFTLLTLGLFLFVVNAICLGVTAWLVPGFEIAGFGSALLGALVVTVVSWMLNGLVLGPMTRPERRSLNR
jgi:putative membrane protein